MTRTWVTASTSFSSWMMGERVAAVDKIEDKRKPEDFIGHRNRRAGHERVKERTKFRTNLFQYAQRLRNFRRRYSAITFVHIERA